MKSDVFISFATHDKQIADRVCHRLEAGNICAWISGRDILPGAKWSESIVDAIAGSRIMVLILSNASNRSEHVIREVELAVSKGLIIIPFRIEEVSLSKSMEYFISSHQWLDAFTPPLEKHIENLVERIHSCLMSESERSDAGKLRSTSVPSRDRENVLILDMSMSGATLRVSGFERAYGEEKTSRTYEEINYNDARIEACIADMMTLLNSADTQEKPDAVLLNELKEKGMILFDELLTISIKDRLIHTREKNLIVSIDDQLVHIPWELLYDGKEFFCRRFSMGRCVSTRQQVSDDMRDIGRKLKMHILSDPTGDLTASYREGEEIRDEIGHRGERIEVSLKTNDITAEYVKSIIRKADIVHYCGHAEYNLQSPEDSGWVLKDGKLTAREIMKLRGSGPMPLLVFFNGCRTGRTGEWKPVRNYEDRVFGLANAFLLSGVQHYIGTFRDISDKPGAYFAIQFYKYLMQGSLIGEAVRKARKGIVERYGDNAFIWASYMLYGDPTFRYMDVLPKESATEKRQPGKGFAKKRETATASSVRGGDAAFSLPAKKRPWMPVSVILLLLLVSFISVTVLRIRKGTDYQRPPETMGETDESRRENVRKQVAALLENYRERQKRGQRKALIKDDGGRPSLVFLNIRSTGIDSFEKDYILSKITAVLQDSKRVKIVEREILDSLLEELDLGSTQLADTARALEVGRILSAELISTGSIAREGSVWYVSIRLIETETTTIRAALTERMETKDKSRIAESLGRMLAEKIRVEYPLQGTLLSVDGKTAVVSLGASHGAVKGMKINIVSEAVGVRTRVGMAEIFKTDENTSVVSITERYNDIVNGLKVEEVI